MSIRECALKSPSFMKLKEVYNNRETEAKRLRNEGKKVVGTFGCDVPDEILLAAGLFPVRVYGEPDLPLFDVDKYLELSFPVMYRSQFEKLINGVYNELFDWVTISSSSDANLRLFYYLKEIRRIEPTIPVPAVSFIDLLFLRYSIHQVRNEMTVLKFKQEAEILAGKQISDNDILHASEICNENRSKLGEFSLFRYGEKARVTGSEALTVIGASLFMEKEDHTRTLAELLREVKDWEEADGLRVFVTGSDQDNRLLYDLIEECGGHVVSEDHNWGDRHFNRNIDTCMDPIKGIVDRYMLRDASPNKALVSERVKALYENVKKTGAEALISFTYQYDDSSSWDFPSQAEKLKADGIPSLRLTGQPYDLGNRDALKNLIGSFIQEVQGGQSHG